jgi:Zn-dependent peptidase ImmA (M78 family)
MFLPIERKMEISGLAEIVADRYCVDAELDLEKVARENNITYSYNYYGDNFDGILEYIDGCFHIYINLEQCSSIHSGRARFTFAHELGHYYLDEHRNALRYGKISPHLSETEYISDSLIEKEADWFATNLLMPAPKVISTMKHKNVLTLDDIINLSLTFKTSITSMSIRIVTLNKNQCGIIKWDSGGKFQWYFISESWFSEKLGKINISIKNLSRETATYQAVRSNKNDCSIFKCGSVLSYWFSNVADENYSRNQIIYEESIRLGTYGFLTYLYPEN